MDRYTTTLETPDAPQRKARWQPHWQDVKPDDPNWEVWDKRVIRRYASTIRPRTIHPDAWNLSSDAGKARLLDEDKVEQAIVKRNAEAARALAKSTAKEAAIRGDGAPAAVVTQTKTGKPDNGAKPGRYPAVNRRIVEFCAGGNSRMGDPRLFAKPLNSKCEHIRLTVT